jgi:ring-1,2-phenylacetyl-CoA epoxidase subunit PaaC
VEPLDARSDLLMALADDELLLGHSDLGWTGVAPTVEEDVAFSSIAQDELGHAMALHQLLADWRGCDTNALAFDRQPGQFRHARLLEQPRGDFAFTIVRRFVYELADRARLEAMADSAWPALADLSRKIALEETLHFDHATLWLERLSAREPGRRHVRAALQAILPLAGGVLAKLPGDDQLVAERVLSTSWRLLHAEWRRQLELQLARLDFADLAALVPAEPPFDRATPPSDAFLEVYREMRQVRAISPGARW